MSVDGGLVALYLVGIFVLCLLCRIFLTPLRWLLRMMVRAMLGGLLVFVWNRLLGGVGWALGLNPFTALLGGVLGMPGLVAGAWLGRIL